MFRRCSFLCEEWLSRLGEGCVFVGCWLVVVWSGECVGGSVVYQKTGVSGIPVQALHCFVCSSLMRQNKLPSKPDLLLFSNALAQVLESRWMKAYLNGTFLYLIGIACKAKHRNFL